MNANFTIEALNAHHDRKSFSYDVEPLDSYFRERAAQDVKRRISNCFVMYKGAGTIAGFYTFAATSLPLNDLTEDLKKRLPRYPFVPAGLIGRLAVDSRFRRQEIAGSMIIDAAVRAARSDPAI